MHKFYQNEDTAELRRCPFYMLTSADVAGTGLTFSSPDIFLSKNGSTELPGSGTVTEYGGGQYYYSAAQHELNTLGFLTIRFVKSSYRTFAFYGQVVGYDPYDGVRLGLTSLPNAAAAANGGLATVDASNAVKVQSGTGSNQINLSAGNVVLQATTHTGAIIPTVTAVTNPVSVSLSSSNYNDIGSGVWLNTTWQTMGNDTAGSGLNFVKNKVTNLTFTSTNLNTIVKAYDTNLDPATQILVTPANKLVTDSAGYVRIQYGNSAGQVSGVNGILSVNIIQVTGVAVSTQGSVDANVVSYASTFSPAEQVLANSSNKLFTDGEGKIKVGVSGIKDTSFELVTEITAVPSYPASPVNMIRWDYAQARHPKSTRNDADVILRMDGSTPVASSQLSDNGTSFTRGVYI